jgi:hypothetical protein
MNALANHRLTALTVLQLVPPRIGDALLNKPDFIGDSGVHVTTMIVFHAGAVRFDRGLLFDGLRRFLAEDLTNLSIDDVDGNGWDIVKRPGRLLNTLSIERQGLKFDVPATWAFSEDVALRLEAFEAAANEVNLPQLDVEKWRDMLRVRPISDQEHGSLCRDFELTPLGLSAGISDSIARGSVGANTLVPRSTSYFQNLVGAGSAVESIEQYAMEYGPLHCIRLTNWQPVEGVKQSLLLSAHEAITRNIRVSHLGSDELVSLLNWAETSADLISKLGIVEMIIRDKDASVEMAASAERMIRQILDDDPADEDGRFASLSTLIIFAGDELARNEAVSAYRPFMQRLAAIAQASLIERCAISAGLTPSLLAKGVSNAHRGRFFYLRAMVDMRREPRWLPDFIAADQLKAEFIGRLATLSDNHKDRLATSPLSSILLGDEPDGVRAQIEFLKSFLPGPLEGATVSQLPVPEQMLASIERLDTSHLEPLSFASLINSALIFKVDAQHAWRAASALRRARYQVRESGDSSHLYSMISGLAAVAAVTGSVELADDVRILSRATRRTSPAEISVSVEFKIALVAAASRREFAEWARFVGDWAYELANEVNDASEAEEVLVNLQCLVEIEPALIATFGKAEAALKAFTW